MRPPDPAGDFHRSTSSISGTDGRSYIYNYYFDLSTLYLVDGLR